MFEYYRAFAVTLILFVVLVLGPLFEPPGQAGFAVVQAPDFKSRVIFAFVVCLPLPFFFLHAFRMFAKLRENGVSFSLISLLRNHATVMSDPEISKGLRAMVWCGFYYCLVVYAWAFLVN